MRAKEFTIESALGTNPKRPARPGSRPDRGHEAKPRYVTDRKTGKQYDPDEEFNKLKDSPEFQAQMKRMATKEDNDPCWKDYKQIGMKKKGGKKVPNCVPKESIEQLEAELVEHGKASRELCKSSKSDADLGASMLASCKSQGLRARDGNKSHKLGKSPESRIKVGGHKLKGKKYGGKLPDWS